MPFNDLLLPGRAAAERVRVLHNVSASACARMLAMSAPIGLPRRSAPGAGVSVQATCRLPTVRVELAARVASLHVEQRPVQVRGDSEVCSVS